MLRRKSRVILGAMLPSFHSLVGKRVDRYEVLAQLGQGGFGAVYRARHTILGTEVALKVLWPKHAEDPISVERFFREARAAASIGSPHIVHVGDAGTTAEGTVFLAMELLPGRDLDRELRGRGRLDVFDAVEILRQVLDGLSAAHRAGIVHRDLKPANVFLVPGPDDAPFVKLLDFGVSKSAASATLTGTGVVIGTPHYMAPEQLEGKSDVDARADVYAAGAMLYEMLAGRVPFVGVGVDVLKRRMAGEAAPPLRSLVPDVPDAVAMVVHRALAADRDARWPSADAMADALVRAADGELLLPSDVATVPPNTRWIEPAEPPSAGPSAVATRPDLPRDRLAMQPGPVSIAATRSSPSVLPPSEPARAHVAATRSTPVISAPPRHEPPSALRSIHPALWAALAAVAVMVAMVAGVLAVAIHRRFVASDAPETAPTASAPPRDNTPVRTIDPTPSGRPPSGTSIAHDPPSGSIDPALVRYSNVTVTGGGARREIDGLLERARPSVARCAAPGRPIHVAVNLIATWGGAITIAEPDPQRPSDDDAIAQCVASAIRDHGPLAFGAWQSAIVDLEVDLPPG